MSPMTEWFPLILQMCRILLATLALHRNLFLPPLPSTFHLWLELYMRLTRFHPSTLRPRSLCSDLEDNFTPLYPRHAPVRSNSFRIVLRMRFATLAFPVFCSLSNAFERECRTLAARSLRCFRWGFGPSGGVAPVDCFGVSVGVFFVESVCIVLFLSSSPNGVFRSRAMTIRQCLSRMPSQFFLIGVRPGRNA